MSILTRVGYRAAPYALIFAVLATIAGMFALLMFGSVWLSTAAKSQESSDIGWAQQRFCVRYDWLNQCAQYRYRRVHRHHHYHQPYRPPVYGYVQRDYEIDRRDGRALCRPDVTTALSDQHKTEDRSRADAVRKWMAAVQHDGGGGEFMDFDAAKHVEWRCGPSDPHDSITGRWSQRLAKITSPTATAENDGRNIRCRVWARPCKAPRESDNDRRR